MEELGPLNDATSIGGNPDKSTNQILKPNCRWTRKLSARPTKVQFRIAKVCLLSPKGKSDCEIATRRKSDIPFIVRRHKVTYPFWIR